VARIFGVNEKHLGEAVWYMKENRAREEDELLQQAARAVVDDHKEIGAVARIFGVNEEYLGRAVWFMKQNRYRQARSLKSDEDIQRAAQRLGIDEKKLRRAMNNGAVWALAADAARSGSPGADYVAEALGLDAEALRSHLRSEREAHRRAEEPKRGRPSWLEYPPS
jgi:hypothetical protein